MALRLEPSVNNNTDEDEGGEEGSGDLDNQEGEEGRGDLDNQEGEGTNPSPQNANSVTGTIFYMKAKASD